MGGSNLPPGVTEGMIPGNRPEDLAEEEFWETLDNQLEDSHAKHLQPVWDGDNQPLIEAIHRYAEIARDLGYQRGVNEGRGEAMMDIGSIESTVDEEIQNWLFVNPEATIVAYLAERAKIYRKLLKKDEIEI